MSMKIPTYIINSFTDEAFKGNPAGVCILENDLEEKQMQAIAKELALSETAFVKKTENQSNYTIRYFSPKMEIPLCGHATLAASKVLFVNDKNLKSIQFITHEKIELAIEKVGEFIQMEFPIYQTKPATVPKELLNALGIQSVDNVVYNEETNILVLEIASCDVLQKLKPDFVALYNSHKTINGVLVTSLSNKKEYDFESRYFWPWSGTNEDPVTGGTHTFLTKYWADKLHKTKMNSYQCSERSGFMEVEIISDFKFTIKSTAQLIFQGYFITS